MRPYPSYAQTIGIARMPWRLTLLGKDIYLQKPTQLTIRGREDDGVIQFTGRA